MIEDFYVWPFINNVSTKFKTTFELILQNIVKVSSNKHTRFNILRFRVCQFRFIGRISLWSLVQLDLVVIGHEQVFIGAHDELLAVFVLIDQLVLTDVVDQERAAHVMQFQRFKQGCQELCPIGYVVINLNLNLN